LAQVKLGELSAILEESLNGLRIIKAFNGEKTIKQKFEQENESHFNALNKILFRRDLAAPLSEFLGITTVAVLLWYGTTLVFKNELSPETFFAFVLSNHRTS
jgi:subfamily B ATP-binding cassette protein MsbA